MISVEEAVQFVQSSLYLFPEEKVPLTQARGRVLRQSIQADRDYPPYNRVTMDGIAIHHAKFVEGARSFHIQSIQQAGMPQHTLENPAHCIEVMTGAVLPNGTNAVIRYEDVEIRNGIASIQVSRVNWGQNIHSEGEDREQGAELLTGGTRIDAPEIAIAASSGYTHLSVSRRPTIAIISTGDELVEVGETPLPHQIRTSNSYMIQAALEELGLSSERLHILDNKKKIRTSLSQLLEQYEVLILSGGVSRGKADYIPDALADLGVQKLFHRVAQRPGKPFWFGTAPNQRVVFALPGNPVSTFVNYHRYVKPWLLSCMGLPAPTPLMAKLSEDHSFKPDLTYFLQVKVSPTSDGGLLATPNAGHGSGDHANLLYNDGFLELPRGKELFQKGEVYPLMLYRECYG